MKLIASSVVRLTKQGADHGHLYLIDVDEKRGYEVLRWADENIKWEGRGGERGLRGIAFYKDKIIVASGTQLLFFDKSFKLVDTFYSHLFGDIHELLVHNNELVITATLFDLILFFDLEKLKLTKGYRIKPNKTQIKKQDVFHKSYKLVQKRYLYWMNFFKNINNEFSFEQIDPSSYQPVKTHISQSIHINSVFLSGETLCFTGTTQNIVFGIRNDELVRMGTIPFGTHNVQSFNDGLIMNYTMREEVLKTSWKGFVREKYGLKFNGETMQGHYDQTHAKPGWNRGLAVKDDMIFFGCSPATVNIINTSSGEHEFVELDSDVRNAIHGLEVLPERFL